MAETTTVYQATTHGPSYMDITVNKCLFRVGILPGTFGGVGGSNRCAIDISLPLICKILAVSFFILEVLSHIFYEGSPMGYDL